MTRGLATGRLRSTLHRGGDDEVSAAMDERTGVLAADITDEDRRNILHRNARMLFGFGDGGRTP